MAILLLGSVILIDAPTQMDGLMTRSCVSSLLIFKAVAAGGPSSWWGKTKANICLRALGIWFHTRPVRTRWFEAPNTVLGFVS